MLVTVFNVTCCCYRNCYDANCYYERVIARTRAGRNCYDATAAAIEFCYICYCERAIASTRTRRNYNAATATANEFRYNCYCERLR